MDEEKKTFFLNREQAMRASLNKVLRNSDSTNNPNSPNKNDKATCTITPIALIREIIRIALIALITLLSLIPQIPNIPNTPNDLAKHAHPLLFLLRGFRVQDVSFSLRIACVRGIRGIMSTRGIKI